MISRRTFLKGAAAVVASSSLLLQGAVARVYGTARVSGVIVDCSEIVETSRVAWYGTSAKVSYSYSVDRVKYAFPKGRIKRIWLDGVEVWGNLGDYIGDGTVVFFALDLTPYGNRVPDAVAEVTA